MTRRIVFGVAAAALAFATLLLWGRYGAAVVLADPGWLCLTG
jgi:hypothetical protein